MPLSSKVSLQAQATIRKAFNDLERVISNNDSSDFATTTLNDVIQAAHNIENELAARQLLRNMRRLSPLFTGLQYYSKSLEVLCNGTPYLPWIWAPIKLILKVASDCIDALEKIIKAYARIAEPLERFTRLTQTYAKDVEFQQILAVFYTDILKFHKEAYKFIRRGGWEVFFMTSWGRFQRRFDGIIDDLKAHEDLVDKTANAITSSDARATREQLAVMRQESLVKVADEEKARAAEQYLAIIGWLKMDDSEQMKLLDSVLTGTQKYSGTCDWILQQEKVAAWMRCSQESDFLILHGHPGTGKSVLVAHISTFLRSAGKSLIISHICTYSQATSLEYDQILRSILIQLVRFNTDLVAYIFEEFILNKKAVTVQAIEGLILTVIGAVSDDPSRTKYIHVILDGLDECDITKQARIIKFLERMVTAAITSTSTVCKILVTSHLPPALAKKLQQKHQVSLSKEKPQMRKAIIAYVSMRLVALQSRWSQLGISDTELKDLESRIADKADGMFLWARLVLEYLTTNMFIRKSEVLGAINTLPRKLSEFYGQILTQLISKFDNRSTARLKSILGWIAYGRRPLRKAELRSALSFSAEEVDVNIEELAPNYLFDMCAPLIEERANSTFAFIHVSVKEFLQSPDSNIDLNMLSAVHEQCLATATCLLSGLQIFQHSISEQDRLLRAVRGFHGLQVYASEYWVEYVLSIAASEKGLDPGAAFFPRCLQLAETLNSLNTNEQQLSVQSVADDRLLSLESYPDIHKAVSDILFSREARVLDHLQQTPGLSMSLLLYQDTIQELLRRRTLPGVGPQDLENFKQDYRFAAFTCRYSFCPFVCIGFENEALRDQHERAHAPRISCDVAGCQHPPFDSKRALKAHYLKYHAPSTSQRMPKIRKSMASAIPLSIHYRQQSQKEPLLHSQPYQQGLQTLHDQQHGGVSRNYDQRNPNGDAPLDSSKQAPFRNCNDQDYSHRIHWTKGIQLEHHTRDQTPNTWRFPLTEDTRNLDPKGQMYVPPGVLKQIARIPTNIKKWVDFWPWINQNFPLGKYSRLADIQEMQYDLGSQEAEGFVGLNTKIVDLPDTTVDALSQLVRDLSDELEKVRHESPTQAEMPYLMLVMLIAAQHQATGSKRLQKLPKASARESLSMSFEEQDLLDRVLLAEACSRGHVLNANQLLCQKPDLAGCDLSNDTNGTTPLHESVKTNQIEIVGLLISRGCILDRRDGAYSTPLHLATSNGCTKIVKMLLDAGCPRDSENFSRDTALHLAAMHGHAEVFRLLVDAGCPLDSTNRSGETALHFASYKGHDEIVKMLIDGGCDLNSKTNNENTALHIASYKGGAEVVRVLIDAGCDVYLRDSSGHTALHHAVMHGRGEIVQILIDGGSVSDLPNEAGITALHQAALLGFTEIVHLLMSMGYDVDPIDRNGFTPLALAFRAQRLDVFQLLLDRGANPSF